MLYEKYKLFTGVNKLANCKHSKGIPGICHYYIHLRLLSIASQKLRLNLTMEPCRKTCLAGLLIRSILRGKLQERCNASAVFSSVKSNKFADQQDMFCFNHTSAFHTNNNIMKMWVSNDIKAEISTENHTGYSRCHTSASCALNMSCSFGQSAYSIESRCLVIQIIMHSITSAYMLKVPV